MNLKHEYTVILTKDNSPTLRLKTKSHEESMHSHSGAFGETIYIYASPFNELHPNKYSILSVGLGLAYNEILSVCEYIKNQPGTFYLESYESDVFLIQQLKKWLTNEPSALSKVYQNILVFFANHYKIEPENIKKTFVHLYEKENIQLKKSIGFTTQFKQKFNIVLYDAFCSRTSPELWTEPFLQYVINQMALTKSGFATYACKSNLNKVLTNNKFNLQPKSGFSGKRESTLALRP